MVTQPTRFLQSPLPPLGTMTSHWWPDRLPSHFCPTNHLFVRWASPSIVRCGSHLFPWPTPHFLDVWTSDSKESWAGSQIIGRWRGWALMEMGRGCGLPFAIFHPLHRRPRCYDLYLPADRLFGNWYMYHHIHCLAAGKEEKGINQLIWCQVNRRTQKEICRIWCQLNRRGKKKLAVAGDRSASPAWPAGILPTILQVCYKLF